MNGIIRDLGFGRRDARYERGLARIREPHEPDIGKELKLKEQPLLFSLFTRLSMPGRLVRGCLEKGIPLAAPAALGNDVIHAVRVEVNDHGAGLSIIHDRTYGHADNDIVRIGAELVLAAAALTVLGAILLLILEVDERAELLVGLDDHIAALAAVAAVRSSPRNIGLATETHATRPAVACYYFDLDSINKI